MTEREDLETGRRKELANTLKTKHELHLAAVTTVPSYKSKEDSAHGIWHIPAAFILGIAACLLAQYATSTIGAFRSLGTPHPSRTMHSNKLDAVALPYAGSTEVHNYPPVNPTNARPALFPSNVGYAGGTPTGAEPGVAATAPANPERKAQCASEPLVPTKPKVPYHLEDEVSSTKQEPFNIFQSWGNLSPWYSIKPGHFGVDSTPEVPDTCRITGLHLLHRHGARYPTKWGRYANPTKFGTKLHENPASWNATGKLEFLNTWTYKLGEELLTPFGRQQLYDLGVSMRLKYGFLLQNFTEKNTIPVFRTESQDRMLYSALNFALGFFGYPLEGKYQQSITIEANNISNSLAPYMTCNNANVDNKGDRGTWYTKNWTTTYLQDAHRRLQQNLHGISLTIEDVYTMQQLCPYETVALGYSKFCELFTRKEWEDFDYAIDLSFWYSSAFGSPVARAQGIGYVQELVARLTHTQIPVHNSSTNATLDDNDITFPLDQSLYVDATHEAVILNILTALNLTSFAETGPLPYKYRLRNRKFRSSELAPFASNVQFQLLECSSVRGGPQIRIIVNDGVVPLTGIKGCHHQKDGMCAVSSFVDAMREVIKEVDWNYDCNGTWKIPPPPEWETVTGSPPKH